MLDDIIQWIRKNWNQAPVGSEEQVNPTVDDEVITPTVREYINNAENKTVTPGRLLGEGPYFINTIPFLENNEQPVFVFPLTNGLGADPGLIVESGAKREKLINGTGSLVISNLYVRILGEEGEWTIPYDSITTVDVVGNPGLHIQTAGRTYYITIAGKYFNETANLWEAVKYIRKQQQDSNSIQQSDTEIDDPLDNIAKLNELRKAGALSEEEFNNRKQSLLEEI